jgi:quercetin dioxygenase-like cupin family protein
MRELGIVVAGSALLTAQGGDYVLGRGSAVAIEPGEIHAWSSISIDLELLIIHEPFLADDLVYVALV